MCLSRQALLSKMTRPVRPLRKHVTVPVHTYNLGGRGRQIPEVGRGDYAKKMLEIYFLLVTDLLGANKICIHIFARIRNLYFLTGYVFSA